MENIVTKLRKTFREEAYELLSELEAALLALERAPDDQDLINRAFRAMHTIKGSGAGCEFNDVASFTHDFETSLDLIRKGRMVATKEITGLVLAAADQIKAMFDAYYYGGSIEEQKTRSLLASLRKLVPSLGEKKVSSASPASESSKEPF